MFYNELSHDFSNLYDYMIISNHMLLKHAGVPKVLCSECSMFRRFYISKVLCFEGSKFRMFYVPNSHWS